MKYSTYKKIDKIMPWILAPLIVMSITLLVVGVVMAYL